MDDWFDDSSFDGDDDGIGSRDAPPARPGQASSCRTFSDGTMQGASGFCWFWFVLMITVFISTAVYVVHRGSAATPTQRPRYFLAALVTLVVGGLNLWIFYHFMQRCQCWQGFFITLVIGLVASAITYIVAPDISSDLMAGNQWPSEEDWNRLKAAFQQMQKK